MKRKLLSAILLILVTSFSISAQENYKSITVSDNISVVQLSENVYLYIAYLQTESWGKVGANGLIVVKENEALMIDTPWNDSQTEELFNWVKDSLQTTITTIIPTHWHEDSMGGLSYLHSKDVNSYANQITIDIAKQNNLPVPQQGFADSLFIDFQDIPVECYYFGKGHSTDNIVVWLPTEDILFGGDVVKDVNSPSLGSLANADVEAWPVTIRRIDGKFSDGKTIIPGHGNIGGNELIQHTIQLLEK